MQTATPQRTSRRPQARKAPVYPELPSSDDKGFSLAVLLRDQAEEESVSQLTSTKAFSKLTKPLRYAMFGAQAEAREQARTYAGYCQKEGLLPFAHAQTTYFDQQVTA